MGQKVNPVGFRLGVNRGWDSVWYAKKKDFGNYLIEDFKIREYIKKNVINSGVSKVMIERTSNKCYVTIYTSRPGFVIGKKGADIEKINNDVKNADTTKSVQIKEEGLQRFLSGDTYGYMLESNPQGAANLLGSFKYNTGMLSPALYEAGISLQQYLNMPDADKAQFEN